MTEIEDVGSAAEFVAQSAHRLCQSRPSGDQQSGIEIPLNRPERLERLARIARRDRRVYADRIDPSLPEIPFILDPGAARKSDDWTTRETFFERRGDAPARLDYPADKGPLGQNPGPAVEQLHRLRSRPNLT